MPEIFYFTAAWCPPCQQALHVTAEVARSLDYPLRIIDIDVDPEQAGRHDITELPTALTVADGTIVRRVVGMVAKLDLIERLNVSASPTPATKVAD